MKYFDWRAVSVSVGEQNKEAGQILLIYKSKIKKLMDSNGKLGRIC